MWASVRHVYGTDDPDTDYTCRETSQTGASQGRRGSGSPNTATCTGIRFFGGFEYVTDERKTMSEQVSIVGGGIVGATTGVFLNLQGYDTKIYTRELPYEDRRVPSVATNYAAASVKPVLVDEDDIGELTRVSEGFFERLEGATETVRRQDNFEVYEDGGGEPDYADGLRRYRRLSEYDGPVPVRRGVESSDLSGYVHEVFFIEMPRYVPTLLRWYRDTGGEVERREIGRSEVGELDGDVVVNAAGYGSPFEDEDLVAVRGHLLHVDTGSRVTDASGNGFSYSYYLGDGRFAYAYPRDDALVLGGSAQNGTVVEGDWKPASENETAEETVDIGGVEVPRHIVETNVDILEGLGIGIDGYEKTACYGYRPYRRGGVRTEKKEFDGKDLVHCYGHGGAGVTLSWLSANRVYNLISGDSGYDYEVVDDLP